ncbi:Nuclear receptor-interacting protein 2 [Dissostichus eleginoides]|uniref:Nuclear receptor-interacting protein 2 n=1 Tax=Dissostichus eleginoides TaxID=100907 RepID=A0AAD9FI54_DISEL|nr:Nuclear receptor-interacting protein 2 [Dissostichus eleginoides]
MSEAKKGELAIRDKAILHQQRRLKQATQFSHKDSADLLPLDGLKRLGTTKDLLWRGGNTPSAAPTAQY